MGTILTTTRNIVQREGCGKSPSSLTSYRLPLHGLVRGSPIRRCRRRPRACPGGVGQF